MSGNCHTLGAVCELGLANSHWKSANAVYRFGRYLESSGYAFATDLRSRAYHGKKITRREAPPSSRGGVPPARTDPCVTASRYTALAVLITKTAECSQRCYLHDSGPRPRPGTVTTSETVETITSLLSPS